ncbi:ribonuclease H-like domain-containing protein [Tanacetum coccineum]
MQKAILKQQFEAFTISSSEGLEKGYDRFQQLLSQLEAHGAEVSTEDANHKFLRSLPPAWSNLEMTMRTKPDVDTLFIDDLYNNLRVFKQELTSISKSSASAQNVAFVSHSKSSNNKVKSGHTEDLDLLHEDLKQINDVDIEEMDINWQIAMIAIRMKKFYKKTRRRVRIDGNKPVGFEKKKLECFKCHNTGHFARECTFKGTNDGKKRDSFYHDQGAGKKERNQKCLLTMDDGVVNWGEYTVEEEKRNHALMEISSNNEANEIYAKDEKLKKYRRIGMKAVKEKEQLQKTVRFRNNSTKNLWKLVGFRRMQGGICYPLESSKGYIIGKGMIRVGNLDFDSVSFVKELGHFNLFSISQICDKQHKVLFTETECLVVSPNFKMPDENQILLKVPRQHNMYSFDMKTPSLTKDYACLIAKATSDESKLWHRRFSWVFFLATKDETSGILQNFIRQIENQLNHMVKIIRSDNGTEFKNDVEKTNLIHL